MRRSLATLPVIAFCMSLMTASPASASPIWNGDASQGTGVFATVLCNSPGSLTTQDNQDGRGMVFKFNKPLGLERCEGHSAKVGGSEYAFQNDRTYYIGWDTRTNTDDAGTIFQWKSNGTNDQNQQNYPVLMKVEGGVLKLFHIKAGEQWTLVWSTPVQVNTWKRVVLGIHTSTSASSGWIELHYNGSQVARIPGRTWDDLGNKPRWGTYGSEVTDRRVINWVDGLKIGTTYTDAA